MGADPDIVTWEPATIVGASVAGTSHLASGLPCQDHYAVRRRDDGFVLAVCDGMGSRARADLGAAIAAQAAVGSLDADVGAMVERARTALGAAADDGGIELDDLACTFIGVLALGDAIWIAHVGDGAVVGLDGDRDLHVLSPAEPSEYVNETTALTAAGYREAVRIAGPFEGLTAVAAFTDGCDRAAMDAAGSPHPGFWLPVFDHVRRTADPAEANAAVAQLLAGAKMAEHSDDDKTLVIAWR